MSSSSSSNTYRAPAAVSLDEELANATDASLTMGSSVITKQHLDNSQYVLPPQNKLHPNLYNNSMRDISMDSLIICDSDEPNNSGNQQQVSLSSSGVPGFPDFPMCWTGESSAERKNNTSSKSTRCKSPAKMKRQQRKLARKAVNVPYGSSFYNTQQGNGKGAGNAIKKKSRDERQLRRIEKVVKMQERRRRKRDMGDICRGLASIKC